MFSVQHDDYDLVMAIRAKAMQNLAQGVIFTEWSSMGSDFKAVPTNVDNQAILLATERYLDEYNGNLITQTESDFRGHRSTYYNY